MTNDGSLGSQERVGLPNGALPCTSRSPATFAVHEEGDGLYSLFVAPFEPRVLAGALERLGIAVLFDVTPRWGVASAVPCSITTLRGWAPDRPTDWRSPAALELVHRPEGTKPVAEISILADPHLAVPVDSGTRLAFHLSEDGHGVVYSRETEVVSEVMRAFLEAHIVSMADVTGYPIPDALLTSLVAPLPAELWQEARVLRRRGRWITSFAVVGVDAARGVRTLQETRWVVSNGFQVGDPRPESPPV
jgi:hypothetical protein